jgi:transitional endoplasmic reticulum ATPase
MREFITAMGEKSEEERRQAIGNVRITKKHFEEALGRVKGTLDLERLEDYERQAWKFLYNQEQRSLLEEASSLIKRARLQETGKTEQEVKDLTSALKNAVYARKKDFGEIKRLTEDLKSRLERPMAQMGTAF